MVCRLTVGKKQYAKVKDELSDVRDKADKLCAELTELIETDKEAFNRVMEAFKLPKGSDEQAAQRDEAVEEALSSYGWREGGSAEFRELYAKAVRDILEEMIIHGRKPSFPEVFRRCPGEGGDIEYRKKHRGSFQNFWKILWEN